MLVAEDTPSTLAGVSGLGTGKSIVDRLWQVYGAHWCEWGCGHGCGHPKEHRVPLLVQLREQAQRQGGVSAAPKLCSGRVRCCGLHLMAQSEETPRPKKFV